MNLPAIIDVALGLIVLYLLLSTVCSFAVELIATWRWSRKRLLYETSGRLLTGLAFATRHQFPSFQGLGAVNQRRPLTS